MSHTPSKQEFFPGKQEVKPRAECPECIEYYFSDEELNKPVKRLWIGSGEDGHLALEMANEDCWN